MIICEMNDREKGEEASLLRSGGDERGFIALRQSL